MNKNNITQHINHQQHNSTTAQMMATTNIKTMPSNMTMVAAIVIATAIAAPTTTAEFTKIIEPVLTILFISF